MDVYIYIMYLTLLFFSGITIFLFCFTKHKSYTKSLPPGPSPLPIFGNLMALLPHISTPHKYFAKLAKTYGPIVSLQLGSITAIVISTPTLAKQVLHKNHSIFSTLYDLDAIGAHQHDEFSIGPLSPKSPKWKILRKIYSTQLLSEKMMENMKFHRYKKMEELMGYVRKCALDNISVDVGEAVFDTSFDMICSSIFSMDSGTDSRIREIKNLMNGIITEIGRPNIVDCYPILETIDPQRIRHRLTYYCVDLFNLFDEIIAQRLKCSEEKLRSSDVYSDLMDVILDVAEEQKDEITRDHVHHLLLDLLGAGMDTTSKTMEWAMAELLGNPMMLTKLQQEIDKVVGKAKFVFESDISELPYLQAIVKETLRLHPAAPLLLPRKVEQDIQIEGYQLPKGAMLIVNAWAIGRDPESWADPDTFYPERFLGSELDMKSQFLKLFTFGAGKKICVGMPLALRMISLVLGNLINCFDWKLLHKQNLGMEYDMSDQYGIKILMCLSGYSFLISFVGIARLCL